MLDLAGGTTVYLACGVTDLRKSYNGLAAIIKLKFHLAPSDCGVKCGRDVPNHERSVSRESVSGACVWGTVAITDEEFVDSEMEKEEI